jgi:MFS-type transporter involved in bile tolerance (Atg22 family)
LNALLILISVYLINQLKFNGSQILDLFVYLNISALVSGIGLGFLTDRLSASKVMPLAAVSLALGVAITHFSGVDDVAFWSMVLLGGPGVAGIWVAGRKWVVQLAPKGDVGTLFGFYGLSNKLSILNLILFTTLADVTGGYTASVVVLLASLVAGISVLLTVPAEREGS